MLHALVVYKDGHTTIWHCHYWTQYFEMLGREAQTGEVVSATATWVEEE